MLVGEGGGKGLVQPDTFQKKNKKNPKQPKQKKKRMRFTFYMLNATTSTFFLD